MPTVFQHRSTQDPGKNPSRLRQISYIARIPCRWIAYSLSVLRFAARRAFEHDALGVAKAAAYSSILTFFPALLVLGAILESTPRFEVYVGEISDALIRILPTGSGVAVRYLKHQNFHSVGFLVTTSLLTLWMASSVVVSWMEGFRKAYQLPQKWSFLKERLIACSLVILAGIPLLFSTILIAFGSEIENRVLREMTHGVGPLILLAWTGVRWLVACGTSVAVVALIYHNAIPRTRPWHTVIPGATVATGLWFVTTWLFGWYLRQSTEYSAIYGLLGVGMALLVWMFVVALIVLLGAELNAILFPRTVAQRRAA
jgi:membrane protein